MWVLQIRSPCAQSIGSRESTGSTPTKYSRLVVTRQPSKANVDPRTVTGFGEEWSAYDQSELDLDEAQTIFDKYFSLVDFTSFSSTSVAVDVGCGSGRWARFVAPHVGTLHLVDPAAAALDVARRNLAERSNCRFHHAAVDELPIPDEAADLVYSLGVLHHIPDTEAGIASCVKMVRPGGAFLVYLYYRFDNRPRWFRILWSISDLGRRAICRLPFSIRRAVTTAIAGLVYWPLARLAKALGSRGRNVSALPLSIYREASFYTMRTDALDRFGTRLEKRFTRDEVREMLERSGLERIQFRPDEPFWCAIGYRPT